MVEIMKALDQIYYTTGYRKKITNRLDRIYQKYQVPYQRAGNLMSEWFLLNGTP
jgi:hypothetical protein